jgi:hypothetical protein
MLVEYFLHRYATRAGGSASRAASGRLSRRPSREPGTGGRAVGAAAKLRVPPSTLEHKIKVLKIRKSRFKFR